MEIPVKRITFASREVAIDAAVSVAALKVRVWLFKYPEITSALSPETLESVNEKDYSKMNMKQLKDILTSKGINPGKMKKNEIIDLIEKSSTEKDTENLNLNSVSSIDFI